MIIISYLNLITVTIPTVRPHYLSFLKPLMASDSSSGFSHLWPGVILHSFTDTQRTTERVEKKNKQTNKHGLGSAPSARRGKSMWHFLCILWANASVYSSENSLKATSNADIFSALLLSLSTGLCCSLLLSVFFCSPLSTNSLGLL